MTKKGTGININGNGGQTLTNEWKAKMSEISRGLPVREFRPLARWPAVPHIEQARLDEYRAIPSRW